MEKVALAPDRPLHIASLETEPSADWHSAYSLSSASMRQSLLPQSRFFAPQAVPPIEAAMPKGGNIAGDDRSILHDLNKTIDPCKTKALSHFLPGAAPKALDLVKDKDPDLYARIKYKVKDPTYIGQTGDITEATHDKRGRVNGCTFIQGAPYWLDRDAARSYLNVNAVLGAQHKKIEVDHLNGAGRTFGQEEAIAWRNTGLHARPGKSNHGFGRAIDLQDDPAARVQPSDDKDIREALHLNGFRQGDSHGPLRNDLHHWSYTGPGRATEAHALPSPHKHMHRK